MKEVTGRSYEYLIGYLKNYSVLSPSGTEGSSGLKARIIDDVKTVTG